MSKDNLLQCYNKGCGQKFDPTNNTNDACEHHPGEPVFHDADKLWSCCNKRSKDFTEFLSMPGCTKGPHNQDKAVPEVAKGEGGAAVLDTRPPPRQPVSQSKQRPSFEAKMVKLMPTVTASLSQLLLKESTSNVAEEDTADLLDPNTGIKIGENCKRNGCKATYDNAGSSMELCKYHPGGPVFHEGLKFWSCCKRRTTDFTEFLAQIGCNTDQHLWLDDTKSSQKTECRYDWHQTGSDVYVTVYAKGTTPTFSSVSVSPVRLCAAIRHAKSMHFDLDIELAGLVDPSQCKTSFAATKVEIQLKKDECGQWPRLKIERRKEDNNTEMTNGTESTSPPDEDLTLDLDAVDLSDL